MLGLDQIGEVPDYWGNCYYDDVFFRNGKPEKTKGYCTDVWFNEAKKFIAKKKFWIIMIQ